MSKARRGELETPLPIGFRYDANNRVVLDPDKQVQQTLRTFFQTFRRTGSATRTVRAFRAQGLKFPRRAKTGPAKGEIIWGDLEHSDALRVLHNPRFAGTFFFGRTRQRHGTRHGTRLPTYTCQRQGIQTAAPLCQTIPGQHLDAAVGPLLVESVTPMALEATLTVQQHLQSQAEEVERLRSHQVDRARYEVDLARRRFMKVDPENRLVADELEAEWNKKLRALADAQEDAERQRQKGPAILDEAQRQRILALAIDLPRLWQAPTTPDRERKRMVRLLIEDVTLIKGTPVIANVRFKGGATTTLKVPPALSAWQLRQTRPEVMAAIDELLEHQTERDVAKSLNARGFQTGTGKAFSPWTIYRLRRDYHLRSRFDRLRARGMLEQTEIATLLGVTTATIKVWRRAGLLRTATFNDKGECLYEPPGADAPMRYKYKGITAQNRRRRQLAANPTDEVEHEA